MPPAPSRRLGRVLPLTAFVALVVTLGSVDAFVAGWRGGFAWTVAWAPSLPVLTGRFALAWGVVVAVAWVLAAGAGQWTGPAEAENASTPLLWVAAAALPFVPGVGDALPGLLILCGPLLWVLLGSAVLAAVWSLAGPRWLASRQPPNPRPAVLFVVSLLIYATLGLTVASRHGVAGDEPHYLVMVESLLRDGDLRVENNYEDGHYRAFVPTGPLPPHSINRGLDGIMYSVHAPGLAMLLAPAYAAAGRAGATLMMALIAAVGGVAIFLLGRALVGPGPALASWAAVAFGTPWLLHGWLIFPEMVAACITAWTLWWLWQSPDRDTPPRSGAPVWIWRGLVLGTLPWFHVKFAVLLGGLGLAVCIRLRRRPGAVAAFLVPVCALVASWFYAFYVMYGIPDPTMPYGGLAAMNELAWANVPRGLLGLAFDQEFGLLLHAPVFALVPFGLALSRRRRDEQVLLAVVTTVGAAFLISTTRYYMWWGGRSVPARFLVPALPLVAPLLATAIAQLAAKAWGRAVVAVTLTATFASTLALVFDPTWALAFNDRDGTGNLLTLIQGGGSWTRVLPSFWHVDWRPELLRVLVFAGGLGAGMLAAWLGGRRLAHDHSAAPGPEGHLALAFILGTVLGVSVLGRLTLGPAARDAITRDGQLRLLEAWQPGTWVETSRLRGLSGRALLQRLQIPLYSREARSTADMPDNLASWLGPFALPPGLYDVRVWWQGDVDDSLPGEVQVRFTEGGAVAAAAPASEVQPLVVRFEVEAANAPRQMVIGVSTTQLLERIARVELRPVELDLRERR